MESLFIQMMWIMNMINKSDYTISILEKCPKKYKIALSEQHFQSANMWDCAQEYIIMHQEVQASYCIHFVLPELVF